MALDRSSCMGAIGFAAAAAAAALVAFIVGEPPSVGSVDLLPGAAKGPTLGDGSVFSLSTRAAAVGCGAAEAARGTSVCAGAGAARAIGCTSPCATNGAESAGAGSAAGGSRCRYRWSPAPQNSRMRSKGSSERPS